MNHSRVYGKINSLLQLQGATISNRKNLLINMTLSQMKAIAEVAKRVINGTINPMRRDIQMFERRRLLLRSLASSRVSLDRKKALLKRHHSLVPILLRTVYLIQTILHEVRTARET